MQFSRGLSRLLPSSASRFQSLPIVHRQLGTFPELNVIPSDPNRNFFPLSSYQKQKFPILLLQGYTDTIGLEVTTALTRVFEAAEVPTAFVEPKVQLELEGGLTNEVSDLFAETRVAIKGPYFTPIRSKTKSINIQLRTQYDLFANVVHAHNFPGVNTRHEDIDIVIIRENTEGEYSGMEHSAVPGVVESLKIITRDKSLRIAEYAFQYAVANHRRKVTAIHKANIMKIADGLFLECCQEVAKRYPFIEFESMIVDNTCMQMASKPQQFDVMLLPNLYGNIITSIASGLVGGPGLIPGTNIGINGAIFEQGSRHAARRLAGQNIANPTATILAGVLSLRYLKMDAQADLIENAVLSVFRDTKYRTQDVAQTNEMTTVSTEEFTDIIIEQLGKAK